MDGFRNGRRGSDCFMGYTGLDYVIRSQTRGLSSHAHQNQSLTNIMHGPGTRYSKGGATKDDKNLHDCFPHSSSNHGTSASSDDEIPQMQSEIRQLADLDNSTAVVMEGGMPQAACRRVLQTGDKQHEGTAPWWQAPSHTDRLENVTNPLESTGTVATPAKVAMDAAGTPRAQQHAFNQRTLPEFQWTRQPNPNSTSLGAVNPEAAEIFQSAFDQAVGIAPLKTQTHLPCSDAELSEPTFEKRLDDLWESPAGLLSSCQQALDKPLTPFGVQPSSNRRWPEFRKWIANLFCQKMMYVSGETSEPSVETTSIIEEIVRQQVIEILRQCTELAARRGSRSITINDLIFQIRHDAPKVSRLRTFLSWKDVRKNVKDSDDKGGDADLGAGEDPVGGVVPGGPVDDTTKKNKKAKVRLPWEPSSFYSVEVPDREDEEDEEEEEMNYITIQRLHKADERTKAMTREEYVTWSEFRQASFTYRKGKRFREWAGFGIVTDSKPSDDIVDILGFLTFEMVQNLTEEALKVKGQEDAQKERTGENSGEKKRKLSQGLFNPPSEGKTPVEPRHIQEAFRRLQIRHKKYRAMLNGTKVQSRNPLKLF